MTDPAQSEVTAGQRFAFGENWQRFLDLVDDQRIRAAEESLTDKLGVIAGLRFVDVGSGSGLFSLAARNLGAQVVSFDFDAESVACTAELRRRYRPGDGGWRVEQGSALDVGYLASLNDFDVVYSWGVLHHTGDMWAALGKVAGLVAPGGRLFVALYNDQGPISHMWRGVKRTYVKSGPRGRAVVVASVGSVLKARAIVAARVNRSDRSLRRGMDVDRDILDWVGGWPFQVSTPEKMATFMAARGFNVVNSWTVGRRMGNNEFLLIHDVT